MNIRILNKHESAKLVKVSNKTIHEWAKLGKINKYIIKGCKTFKVSEFEIKEAKEGRFVASYIDNNEIKRIKSQPIENKIEDPAYKSYGFDLENFSSTEVE